MTSEQLAAQLAAVTSDLVRVGESLLDKDMEAAAQIACAATALSEIRLEIVFPRGVQA